VGKRSSPGQCLVDIDIKAFELYTRHRELAFYVMGDEWQNNIQVFLIAFTSYAAILINVRLGFGYLKRERS